VGEFEVAIRGLASRLFALPWLTVPPIGLGELSKLVSDPLPTAAVQA
jgi:arsenite-transporting ATPase